MPKVITPYKNFQADPFGWGLIATVDPATTSSTGGVQSANDANFWRIRGGGNISKIGVHIGVSSGNISVAVYRNSGVGRNAAPGTRLATSGSIACPAAGYAEISLGATVAVQPGDWFAITANNTTATWLVTGAQSTSDIFKGRAGQQSTAHPAPATLTPTWRLNRAALLVGVA